MKWCKRLIAFAGFGFVCLIGWLALRQPWVTQGPAVRMSPIRPILRADQVPPDSAFDLLLRAGEFKELDLNPIEYLDLPVYDTATPVQALAPDVLALLDALQPNLALARRAAATPAPQVPTVQSFYDKTGYLGITSTLVQIFTVSIWNHGLHGRIEDACNDFISGLRLNDIMSRGGPLRNFLYARAMMPNLFGSLWALGLDHHLNPAQTEAVSQALLQFEQEREPLAETCRNQLLLQLDFVDKLEAKKKPAILVFKESVVPGMIASLFGSSPTALRRNFKNAYAHLIDLAEKPFSPGAFEAVFPHLHATDTQTLLKYRDPFGAIHLRVELQCLARTQISELSLLAMLRGMRVFLAVRQWEANHDGRAPEKLEQLIPEFLPTVPLDPFDNQPLRYKIRDDRSWVIYSIGKNLLDDDGIAAAMGSSRDKDIIIPSKRFTPQPKPRKYTPPPKPRPKPTPFDPSRPVN